MDDGIAVVGITDFAQQQLGDVVYVELPKVGSRVESMKVFGVVESVKTASDLYSPLTGEVVEVNKVLENSPQLVNDAPYANGWMIKIRPDDAGQVDSLLTADAYEAHISA
jgi:glycine cleavage system H protein